VNGEQGSVAWNLEDLHRLSFFEYSEPSNLRGWRSIHVSESEHPYMKNWWVPGLQIGYEHSFIHQLADLLCALSSGKVPSPSFREALETERVTDAVLASARKQSWVTLKPGK
jgi:myo-inositol 2-dehydrogenase/D-chiro-inositol 1-dehydrogenase